MLIWLGVVIIVTVLGLIVWWMNKRAAQVQDDISYLGEEGFSPFHFSQVWPPMRRK